MTTSDEIHKKVDEISEQGGTVSTQEKQVNATLLVAEVLNELNWNLTYIRKELEGIKKNL